MRQSKKRPRILVVGSMNIDLCMNQVQGMPRIGTSTFCKDYLYCSGGKGANQALAVAKQGGDAVMVGRVGATDREGKQLLQTLNAWHVNTEYVIRDELHLTGMSVMNILQDGKYFSIYAGGANHYISPTDVEAALEASSYEMIVLQLEMPMETVRYCCKEGKKRNIPVFLDAGPAMKIPLEYLEGCFILSPNEAETEALTGQSLTEEDGIRQAARILYEGAHPQYVLLKLGEKGACLYDGKNLEMIPCYSVNAIDSTAAGDTFGATVAVQYCLGRPISEAIQLAHAAAALCVTRKGGSASVPTLEETLQFYEARKGKKDNGIL